MNVETILRQRESQQLELESASVLARDPDSVIRAVVGMLNADGGEIWIGVEEGADVATAIHPVPAPQRARSRLLDHLTEKVGPPPLEREVSVEVMPTGSDPALLVVRVRPPSDATGRRPFAYRRKGGWHFLRRINARNHTMSREEVFLRAVPRSENQPVEAAIRGLATRRRDFRDSGRDGLWMEFRPVRSIRLDLESGSDETTPDSPPGEPGLLEIATDPSVTGNRRVGAHFAMANRLPRAVDGRIEWDWWSERIEAPVSRSVVREDGSVHFWAALELLRAPEAFFGARKAGVELELDSVALHEFPISAFRIVRQIYRPVLAPGDLIAVDLALFDITGWALRREDPETNRIAEAEAGLERWVDPDLIGEPLLFELADIQESPDRCGFRLVDRVYHSFGIGDEEMPRYFDRETGRLILPR